MCSATKASWPTSASRTRSGSNLASCLPSFGSRESESQKFLPDHSFSTSELHAVACDYDPAAEVRPGGVDPHLIGDRWVVGGHQMREHQRLHPGCGRDAPGVLGRRVVGQDALLE